MRILTRDRSFYATLLHLMVAIILQNIVAYSVNMADNLMLGIYSQAALSGAATVNMIQFLFQCMVVSLGDAVVVLGSQYWGQGRREPVCRLTGIALLSAGALGAAVLLATSFFPYEILRLFTPDEATIQEGMAYLELIRFTYPLFALSTVLMAALRTVGTVNISFGISVMSLVVDVGINYALIFGKFGLPELGVRGASVGTLAARGLELLAVLAYLLARDKKLRLFAGNPFRLEGRLCRDYGKVAFNLGAASLLWGLATPIQTGILGHLTPDAIAANSVSTTLFQYLKVVTQGEASAASVLIGQTVGKGDMGKIREYSRTLQILFLVSGLILGVALFFVRIPLLGLYDLTPEARVMANQILIVMCFVMVGMAYQMPTGSGIVRGGGDTKFMLYMNLISTWGIVMPLSFMAAFWWRLPVAAVVAFLNADQVFKCLPSAIWVNSYRWVRRLTRGQETPE